MVSVGCNVRAANPSNQVSNAPIEVKQSGRNHSGAVGINVLFIVPVRLEAAERVEIDITMFSEELEELGN